MFTVKAKFSFVKTKLEHALAGNKGLINYYLVDSKNAELTFSPLECPSSSCNPKDFAYSSITAEKI